MNSHLRKSAVLAFAIAGASIAFAHGRLETSNPANGARLEAAPEELRFRFSEPIEPALSMVKLLGPGDKDIGLEKAHAAKDDARSLVVGVPKLAAGDYRARWATSGHDGHRVKGEVHFSVK